jgi:hypothetical protein
MVEKIIENAEKKQEGILLKQFMVSGEVVSC